MQSEGRRIARFAWVVCMALANVASAVVATDSDGGAGAQGAIGLPEFAIEDSVADQERWPEELENMFPFRRAGLFGPILVEDERAQEEFSVLTEQVAALAEFRPGEFASASGASTPRGFTAPRLRNGIVQSGFPEILVGGRRELLTGFLATYFGRTAPGGIHNNVSLRPAPRPSHAFGLRVNTLGEIHGSAERHAPLVPKKLHYRLTTTGRLRDGVQAHASESALTSGLSLRWAQGRRTVWLIEFEHAVVDAEPVSGIPLQRATRGAPRAAPYAPLAEFNGNGPGAWSWRESGIVSVLAEHSLRENLKLRAAAETWTRRQRELRFNTGPYLLDEGVFEGTREPQYNGRRQSAQGVQIELDGHGRLAGIEHRWLLGMFATSEGTWREQRALPIAERNALPVRARVLDPTAPDWSTPAYSESRYARLLALRDEESDYAGVFLSERFALSGDRFYGTLGLRGDRVRSLVEDLRPGAAIPRAGADVSRTTWHAGGVWHAWPGRLAGYFNHSTAFQPARRVDARTGRIIGNESTAGVESGVRYASADSSLVATAGVFRLWNENITRVNPRYNDAVLDPDGRQSQYVSSGEERFTGAEASLRRRFGPGLNLAASASWLDAVTTASPDLPEEVGRQLARLPRFTAAGNVAYRFQREGWKGLRLGAAYAWVGDHVAVYASERRNQAHVAYGSYGVLNLTAGYDWVRKKRRHAFSLAVRNVLDRDLVADAGRLGGELAVETGYGLRF
jgi:iron complex outermembrane receptor protein